MAYIPDGEYPFEQIYSHLDKDFKTEKEMCDYIERHMASSCFDLLNTTLKSYKREYRLYSHKMHGSKSVRLDFLITGTQGQNIIVECKNPFYACENQTAIGQLLGYKELAKLIELPLHRSVLVTSTIDVVTTQIVKNNCLGIELTGLDKSKSLTLRNLKYSENTAKNG